jgi:hypothetical protein
VFLSFRIKNTGLEETFLNVRIALGLELELEIVLTPLSEELNWLLVTVMLQTSPIQVWLHDLRDELGTLILHFTPISVVAKEIH